MEGTGMIGIMLLLLSIEIVLFGIKSELSDIAHWLWAIAMFMREQNESEDKKFQKSNAIFTGEKWGKYEGDN